MRQAVLAAILTTALVGCGGQAPTGPSNPAPVAPSGGSSYSPVPSCTPSQAPLPGQTTQIAEVGLDLSPGSPVAYAVQAPTSAGGIWRVAAQWQEADAQIDVSVGRLDPAVSLGAQAYGLAQGVRTGPVRTDFCWDSQPGDRFVLRARLVTGSAQRVSVRWVYPTPY